MKIERVFLLHHVHELDEVEDVKLIGVYSSEAMAEAARARVASQPGFVDDPAGFHVGAYELDKDHWTEGFVTVVAVEVPLKGSTETVTAHASRLKSGLYELWPERVDPTESWMFKPCETIRCESRSYPDGSTRLVAVERVEEVKA